MNPANSPTAQWILFGVQIATLIALVVYVWKTWEMASATRQAAEASVRSQQEATALGIWKDYIQLALTHPELASASASVLKADMCSAQYREYEWFVSAMLFACEQIITLQPHDREWRASIADHLNTHRVYLSNPNFRADRYSLELRHLLSTVARGDSTPRVV